MAQAQQCLRMLSIGNIDSITAKPPVCKTAALKAFKGIVLKEGWRWRKEALKSYCEETRGLASVWPKAARPHTSAFRLAHRFHSHRAGQGHNVSSSGRRPQELRRPPLRQGRTSRM